MEHTIRKHGKERIQLNSLADLDRIVSEKSNLLLLGYRLSHEIKTLRC